MSGSTELRRRHVPTDPVTTDSDRQVKLNTYICISKIKDLQQEAKKVSYVHLRRKKLIENTSAQSLCHWGI